MLLISFSQVCEENFDEVDRLPEADSSVLLLGSDGQLAVSAGLVWQDFKMCLVGLFVSSWWRCWCTPSVPIPLLLISQYKTLSRQVPASSLKYQVVLSTAARHHPLLLNN